MNEPAIHILVCTNMREGIDALPSCSMGGAAVLGAFRDAVKDRGLATTVKVTATGCLTPCTYGPNVVVYPAAVWYCGVGPADVDEILTAHESEGLVVERLLLPAAVRVL